jgi:hypothetical protein
VGPSLDEQIDERIADRRDAQDSAEKNQRPERRNAEQALTVTEREAGVNTKPVFVGVTGYTPFATPVKL